MKHNSFFVIILLAAIFVGSCVVGANGQDSDTYSPTLMISLKDGKALSPEDAVDADFDGGSIETDATGKQFWKLDEWGFVTFSFALTEGVKAVEAEIQCVTNADVKGKATVSWNRQFLKDESGKNRTVGFDGVRNFKETLSLSEPLTGAQTRNQLRIYAADGTVGIQSVIFRCEIPYPSWNFNELVIRQTAPRPDMPLDGKPVTVKWKTTTGMPEGGWLMLEYDINHSERWQVVPGFEGITYGKPGWDSPNGDGEFLWENPPVAKKWELKFTYTTGENPIEKKIEKEKEKAAIGAKTLAELSKIKWDFLIKAKGYIPRAWRSQAPEKYQEAARLEAQLELIFDEPEKLQPNIEKTVGLLDQLDVLYCNAMLGILSNAATLEDKKERDDLLEKAEDFIALREATYNRASVRYADDEETAQYLKVFFHKERVEMLRGIVQQFKDGSRQTAEEDGYAERLKNPRESLLFYKNVFVHDFCVTSSGHILAAYSPWKWSSDGRVPDAKTSIYDVSAESEICSFDLSGSRYAFSPCGTYFFRSQDDLSPVQVVVWAVNTLERKKDFFQQYCVINMKDDMWSPNDRFIIMDTSTAKLYDFSSRQERTLVPKSSESYIEIVFSLDEKRVATTVSNFNGIGFDGSLFVWDAETGREIAKSPSEGNSSLTFSHDGKILASIQYGPLNVLQFWDIDNQKKTNTAIGSGYEFPWGGATRMLFSPDNRVLAIIGAAVSDTNSDYAGVTLLYDVGSCQFIRAFGTHHADVNMKFFPSGRYLVIGHQIFDVATGELITTLGDSHHNALYISPDSSFIITQRIDWNESEQTASLHQWSFGDNPFPTTDSTFIPLNDIHEIEQQILNVRSDIQQIETKPLDVRSDIQQIETKPLNVRSDIQQIETKPLDVSVGGFISSPLGVIKSETLQKSDTIPLNDVDSGAIAD